MKLSADDAHFLDAVRTSPDDDEPRLVYADLLQQLNSPWGELIVVQCALARHRKTGDTMSDAYAALLRSEHNVLATRDTWWMTEFGYPDVVSFSRGFPDDVTFASATELTTAHAWLKYFPPLTQVRVELREGEVLRLFTIDHLPTRELMIMPQPTPSPGYLFDFLDAGVLLKWLANVAPKLESFSVAGDIEQRALEKLLASELLAGIRRLALTDARLGYLNFLSQSLAQPEELVLDANPMGWGGYNGRALANMRRLSVHNTQMSQEAIVNLAFGSSVDVSSIVAGGTQLGGPYDAFFNSTTLEKVERLDVSSSGIAPDAIVAIAGRFNRLRDLNIGANRMTDESVRLLMRAAPKLRHIGLSKSDIGPESIEAIAEHAATPTDANSKIETLGLWSTRVGDRGAEIIASSPIFSGLRTLELSNAGLTPKGARALASSTTLPSVLRVEVSAREVGADEKALEMLRERFAIVITT